MNTPRPKTISAVLVVVGLCLAVVFASHAQSPRPVGQAAKPALAPAGSAAAVNAEREQIWNSPNMLRARAWLQDYCSKSAKVTAEMAKEYQTELANMTPAQMKLWLTKFDEEEETRQQKYTMWQKAHTSALNQAMAADQATNKTLAGINQEETEAAGEAQQQINEQQQFAQTEEANKQIETAGAYGPDGYNPAYGGIHYHFHLYPY